MQPIRLELPADVLDQIAEAVKERLRDELLDEIGNASPWMDRKQLARYTSLGLGTIEKDKTIPCHRFGEGPGRVLYHRDEVDAWLLAREEL